MPVGGEKLDQSQAGQKTPQTGLGERWRSEWLWAGRKKALERIGEFVQGLRESSQKKEHIQTGLSNLKFHETLIKLSVFGIVEPIIYYLNWNNL